MEHLLEDAGSLGIAPWSDELRRILAAKERYIGEVDGKGKRYLGVMEQLFTAQPSAFDFTRDAVTIGCSEDISTEQRAQLTALLHQLDPWRKGPFELFGIEIDSEWVSSLKWRRVQAEISSLKDRKVLDIGCSNGYYLYRMLAEEPRLLLGIEPYLTFYFQFRLLQHFARQPNLSCLPLRFEELPELSGCFDTIFSMGVLYHQRSPIEGLGEIRKRLRKGGELVLETLVIEGEEELALSPKKRYAKMNNVFFLPTVTCLSNWLARAGFTNIRCIDVSRTTSAEQRKSDWMQTESLADFLDPEDCLRTIEGYPAPVRAVLVAEGR